VTVSVRHHYTPRYYLERFENHDGAMWRRENETGRIVKGNSDHFGYKKHWNTQAEPPVGMSADWAEKKLSEIDALSAAVVKQIVAGHLPADIRALACAVAFMKYNQPSMQKHLNSHNEQEVSHWSNDHWLISRLGTAVADWESYIPYHYSVYVINEADERNRFLTASNPLIEMENQLIKLLPISNRHCLMMMYDPQFEGCAPYAKNCDSETVAGINQLILKNSWQYVYSCRSDFAE
jgi:hypothetical protein